MNDDASLFEESRFDFSAPQTDGERAEKILAKLSVSGREAFEKRMLEYHDMKARDVHLAFGNALRKANARGIIQDFMLDKVLLGEASRHASQPAHRGDIATIEVWLSDSDPKSLLTCSERLQVANHRHRAAMAAAAQDAIDSWRGCEYGRAAEPVVFGKPGTRLHPNETEATGVILPFRSRRVAR